MEWQRIDVNGYWVSSTGVVIGPRGKPLTQSLAGPDGYLRVTVHPAGPPLTRYVHQLVCAAFCGPKPSPRHHASHLDGNKLNNAADNLAWKLPAENEADKIRHGTHNHRGERNTKAKLTLEAVRSIRTIYGAGRTSQRELAAKFGVAQPTISGVVRRQYWPDV